MQRSVVPQVEKGRELHSPRVARGNALVDSVTGKDNVEGDRNANIVDEIVGRDVEQLQTHRDRRQWVAQLMCQSCQELVFSPVGIAQRELGSPALRFIAEYEHDARYITLRIAHRSSTIGDRKRVPSSRYQLQGHCFMHDAAITQRELNRVLYTVLPILAA